MYIIIIYKAISKLLKYGTIFFTMTIQISIYNFYWHFAFYLYYYYYFRWTDCKGSCGETGYMSRYRSTTSSDVLCEFNHEWKTCNVLGCTIRNYTEAAEGNELKTRELNYILEITRNTNQIFWNACFSDHCNYNALKNEFTNNTVSLKFHL